MCNCARTPHIPLEAAIAEALDLAPVASEALSNFGESFDGPQRRVAYRFASNLDAGEMFSDRDLDDLAMLLKPTLTEIEQGWVREVIADENCMSGSWTNQRLTDHAAHLQDSIEPLVKLHRILTKVRNLRRADRITSKFLRENFK